MKYTLFSFFILSLLLVGCKSSKEATINAKTDISVAEETAVAEETLEIVEIKTSFGNMVLWLYDDTPLHKANFLELAQDGFYDGILFHRIIDNFMIQGGDPNTKAENPTNVGNGGPGYTLPAEIRSYYKHKYGSIAAARLGDQANPRRQSSGSQFYIVENKNGTPHLDGAYTVFGEVIKGFEVIDKIAEQPKDGRDKPISDIKMEMKVLFTTKSDLKKKYNFTIPE